MPGSDLIGLVWRRNKGEDSTNEKDAPAMASPSMPAKGQYMGLRGQTLSHVIGVVAATFFFLYGYDQGKEQNANMRVNSSLTLLTGDMGGFLTVNAFLHQFPQIGVVMYPHSLKVAQLTAFTVGIWNLGCLCSAVLTVFFADAFGRKTLMFVGLVFLLVGQILQCTSFAWSQFLVGRFVAGFGE